MPGTNPASQAKTPEPLPSYSRATTYLTANALTAVTTTTVLNKFDEAQYLAIKNNRPFLHATNFQIPYFQGYWATLNQRLLSGGIYFIAQNELHKSLHPAITNPFAHQPLLRPLSEIASAFAVGLGAGTINTLFTNPLAAIKYEIWNGVDKGEVRTFSASAKILWRTGGLPAFYTAVYPTLRREIAFGSTNEVLRFLTKSVLLDKNASHSFGYHLIEFTCNLISSSGATVACSNWNYVRTKHFGADDKTRQKSPSLLFAELRADIAAHSGSALQRASYRASRLNIGWGTFFNAVRMAMGQGIFDNTSGIMATAESAYQHLRKHLQRPS
jgi:hypothetical protein